MIRPLAHLALFGICFIAPAGHPETDPAAATSDDELPKGAPVEASSKLLRVDRGEGEAPVWVPRSERLDYVVYLDLGILGDSRVGTVILRGGVEPYAPPLPMPGQPAPEPGAREVAHLKSTASGRYLNHSLDHDIDVRILPQVWPRTLYRETQRGSSNRKSELRVGEKDGRHVAEYVRDHHCRGCKRREHYVESSLPWRGDYHCGKCNRTEHRVWKPARVREVPEDAIDMLSAICMARSLVSEKRARVTFPLVNKDDLWSVTLTRDGRVGTVETPAGKFRVRRVQLRSAAPPGEDHDGSEFEGLFGIRGDLRIYLHEDSGVPVVIEGDVPVGPLELKVRVKLAKYGGTPDSFRPVK